MFERPRAGFRFSIRFDQSQHVGRSPHRNMHDASQVRSDRLPMVHFTICRHREVVYYSLLFDFHIETYHHFTSAVRLIFNFVLTFIDTNNANMSGSGNVGIDVKSKNGVSYRASSYSLTFHHRHLPHLPLLLPPLPSFHHSPALPPPSTTIH